MNPIDKLTSNTEETITIEELKNVINKPEPRTYIEFNECGFNFTILLADWHAYINDKFDGDIEKIKLCGKYMEDCFAAMGINKNDVKFIYASDYIGDPNYWELVLKTSKATSVARVKRAMDIMGREAEEAEKDLSKLFYPAMQVSDIFYLKLDVAYGGTDQRHAHMLARDVSKKLKIKTPVAIHTPLLTGLQAGGRMDPLELKMSKSKPDSMISIHDNPEDVKNKIKKAFCPEKQIIGNPIIEICKYIIFPELEGEAFVIERPEKYGGNLEFLNFEDLKNEYIKDLHPLDLKFSTIKYLNKILEPIHSYFNKNFDNYNKMKELKII